MSVGASREGASGADAARAAELHALYARHSAGIRRYLVQLVGTADAEDVMHDAFEKAQRAMRGHRGASRLSTWLYRIATHAALDRLRSRTVREREITAMAARDDAGQADRPPDAALARARMRACILGLVDALPPTQRAVVMLAELRGLSDRETAEMLGITVGAAKIRLHRGRSALKKLIQCECRTYRDEHDGLTCEPVRGTAQRAVR